MQAEGRLKFRNIYYEIEFEESLVFSVTAKARVIRPSSSDVHLP